MLRCDCCDQAAADIALYPTEDDDAVLLCGPCAAELREMVGGEF